MEKKRKLDRVSSSSSEVSAEPVPKPSESVKVALLIRPLLADERAAGQNVCLRKVEGKPEVALDGAGGFKFDHVSGPDEPVDVVFERCVLNSILANVLQGFNGTVLAYGQTRSGKTHAMGSGALRGAPSGLIQLAVAALFERLPEGTTVHASFTQIYCEEVHDLLNCSKDGDLATLPIKGSTATGYSLPTAERVLVSSLEDVMAAIARGAANRATGATKMNAHSSRCAQFLSARNSSRRAILCTLFCARNSPTRVSSSSLRYSTGSSLMPQKKNPDALELIRGKAGRVLGHQVALLTSLKGLPTAYNKDLQEDKAALFDALDTVEASLQIASGVLATITPVPERMKASLNSFMLATDLSEYLVRRGVPFRETHHVSGRAVQLAEERGCALTDLTLADLQGLHPLFADDVMGVWDFEAAVERRDATGGTSKRSVLQQAATLEAWSNEK